MTRRMSKEELAEALKNIKEDSINNEESPMETYAMIEHMQETHAQYAVYDALSEEERKRWPEIQLVVAMRDNNKIAKHNLIVNQELDRLDTYFRSSGLDTSEIEKYLMDEIRDCTLKISQYAYGRELLDNYSIEKFMLLFIDGDYYKPLNLYFKDLGEKKSVNEIKGKLIKHYARLKALGQKLMNLDNSLPENLHLKDVTKSDAHYESIIKTLLDEGIIYEVGEERYTFKRSNQFSTRDLAHFVNSLYSFGFLKFKITNEQGITLSKNTFGRKYSTGYADETDFMPKQYEWLKNLILSNLLNTSE